MLKTLHVTNLGIFEDAEVDLCPGLVCLTGETGAGKSLLLDAIKLLLGARADASVVRHGEKSAMVEAVFDASGLAVLCGRLDEAGYGAEDGEVTLRRTVGDDGRSRAWIQGRIATARELREIGGDLVSIAGQHAFMSLSKPAERLAMLDTFAGLDDEVAKYRVKYGEFCEARNRLRAVESSRADMAARRDYLEFVIGQIDELDPVPGEVEDLEAEARVLKSAGRLRELALSAGRDLFEGERSAFDSIGRALKAVQESVGIDQGLGGLAGRLESIHIDTREAARDISAYIDGLESDPRRLEAVTERLHALRSLARKHGGTLEAVLATRDEARDEVAAIDRDSADAEGLSEEVAGLEADVGELADALTSKRTGYARKMSEQVSAALQGLDMQGARLKAELGAVDPGPTGRDRLDFLVRTNPGEGIGALEDIASGGELSRVALSLFSVLSGTVGTPVMVFDEIDVGVSGGVADRMGETLERASRDRQVIVVTHHGQVAARAGSHFLVEKNTVDGRTVASIAAIEGRGRLDEIARMVGGREVTEKVVAHARELLERQPDLL